MRKARAAERLRSAALSIEAAVHLAGARLAVAALPFPTLMRLLIRSAEGGVGDRDARRFQRVRNAVAEVARWPFAWASCLPQAVAAHWMLARRGVRSRLCFGVKRGPNGLCSHAWLTHGREVLPDNESTSEFPIIAEFPAPRRGEDENARDLGNLAARR